MASGQVRLTTWGEYTERSVSESFVYIWVYRVQTESVDRFCDLYGPNGGWVSLLRQASGYVETILLRDLSDPERFVTIDRWQSKEAFVAFRTEFSAEFERLDRAGEELTEDEVRLGEFIPAGPT